VANPHPQICESSVRTAPLRTSANGARAGAAYYHARRMDAGGQAARLRQFLTWDIVINLATVPCMFVLYALFPTPFFALLGIVVLANAALLVWATQQVSAGRLQRAVFAVCVGLWLIATLVGLGAPVTLPFIALLLVWPVALALPYLRGRQLRWVVAVSTAISVGLTVWSGRSDPFQVEALLPTALVSVAMVICVPLFTAFIFLLLWHDSSRLHETLEQTRTANAALRESEHLLEARVDDRTRELAVARDQALEATRAKSTFLANMSHELRTPLNAILGYTELILDGIYGPPTERISDVLQRVDKSGHHLLELINDVLDLSRIEAGQLSLSVGEYCLSTVVAEVCLAIQPLAVDKGLTLETKIPDNLPRPVGDERRIRQVLLNLLGNAVKFTDAGVVWVEARVDGDTVRVSVSDSGPGVAEADTERIFEVCQQADGSSTKQKGGSGLGLAISRRIVELHGGRLWLERSGPPGATFTFTLPIGGALREVSDAA
jgi:signal transduction histidine kinase